MKRISDKPPVSQTQSEVARYLDLQLQAMRPHKSQAEIADEAGLPQRNLLSMIRTGVTKLPFERIPGLAKALNVDPAHLFRLALAEYQPHIKALIEETARQIVSRNEQHLLAIWREATEGADPPVAHIEDGLRTLGERALGAAREPNFLITRS